MRVLLKEFLHLLALFLGQVAAALLFVRIVLRGLVLDVCVGILRIARCLDCFERAFGQLLGYRTVMLDRLTQLRQQQRPGGSGIPELCVRLLLLRVQFVEVGSL